MPLFLVFATCAAFVLAPHRALAYEMRVSPDISISENYISEDNLYMAGVRTFFNTTYENEVVSVAFEQIIQGTIFGDVTLMGNKLQLGGEMFDDVRVIANDVRISGVTNKDLVIVANHVSIEQGAIVNGDTLILANTIDANGQFLGESQLTANRISVGGSLVGPATLTSQRLDFVSGAKVLTDVSYFSPQRATIAQGVEIQKPLNFNQIESIKQNDVVKKLFFGFVSFWSIIKLIATLFVIFILTHVFRLFAQGVVDTMAQRKWLTLIIGFFALIVIPLVVLVLFASLVLIPVSVILGFSFVITLILLPAMSAILLSGMYQTIVQKKPRAMAEFQMSALALIMLTFLGFVPYVGDVTVYLLYVAAFGAIVSYMYNQIRRRKIKV